MLAIVIFISSIVVVQGDLLCPVYHNLCAVDQHIVIDHDDNDCEIPRCVPDCPLLSLCAPEYETIISRDENGCPVHHCKPTCELIKCAVGQVCELQPVECVKAPCFDQPTCVDLIFCPRIYIVCKADEIVVRETDKNGCEIPHCESPCASVKCPQGTQCAVKVVKCLIAPCPPVASCQRKCKDGQVWKECASHCNPTCDNTYAACIKSCAPAQCQCPPEKPIWSKGKCIAVEECYKCREPMAYKRCGSACPLTCKTVNGPPVACIALCVEGCFCPTELPVLHGKKCISVEDCPPPGH